MSGGMVRFTVEGLSLERFINRCLERNIHLTEVKRTNPRILRATVCGAEYPLVEEIAGKVGWKLTRKRVTGLPVIQQFAWRRAALLSGALIFLALVWAACNCVWDIRIVNAGPYIGEARTVLRENDIYIGRFTWGIDVDALRTALERRLTGLSWVTVQLDGVRLTVHCVIGIQGADNQPATKPGDLVAAQDGVIESLRVTAGTAAVKQGEVVRKGQVLIHGEERAWQGAVTPVCARGEVLARVWYEAEVLIPRMEKITVPVGTPVHRTVYCTPWMEWSPQSAPESREPLERTARNQVIGGVFPVWLRQEMYEPVTFETRPRSNDALREEAATAARRLAQQKAGLTAHILNEWLEFTEAAEGVYAKATLEVMINIAALPN